MTITESPIEWLDPDQSEFNLRLVRRLVAAQFPDWRDLPLRPAESDGWDNRTFRLGSEMSVRLPSHERYAAQVPKEHTWLPRLQPQLPLLIPTPLAMGAPGEGYQWRWSIYRWLAGRTAAKAPIDDRVRFARTLACFLTALHRADTTEGPLPGQHNFFRGGDLSVYDSETRDAISQLRSRLDESAAEDVWEAARSAPFTASPGWVHGDLAATNLLVVGGRLDAVIDFGCSAVGDPACDLVVAWTFFSGKARETFRGEVEMDEGTWARARGWALWKALITLRDDPPGWRPGTRDAKRVVTELVAEHRRAT